MRVTIFGASGQTGRALARQSRERGDDVTVVLRDPSRLGGPADGLTLRTIPDLTDTSAVAAAVAGAELVFSCIGPRARNDGPVASDSIAGILAGLDGAPTRVVAISAAPVGTPDASDSFLNRRIMLPFMNAILKPVYADLERLEELLAASGTAWTAMRPPRLTNGPLTGVYRTAIGHGVPRGYSLSREDLAHAMLAVTDDPEAVRAAVGVAY